jgi:hypothetical protein
MQVLWKTFSKYILLHIFIIEIIYYTMYNMYFIYIYLFIIYVLFLRVIFAALQSVKIFRVQPFRKPLTLDMNLYYV